MLHATEYGYFQNIFTRCCLTLFLTNVFLKTVPIYMKKNILIKQTSIHPFDSNGALANRAYRFQAETTRLVYPSEANRDYFLIILHTVCLADPHDYNSILYLAFLLTNRHKKLTC